MENLVHRKLCRNHQESDFRRGQLNRRAHRTPNANVKSFRKLKTLEVQFSEPGNMNHVTWFVFTRAPNVKLTPPIKAQSSKDQTGPQESSKGERFDGSYCNRPSNKVSNRVSLIEASIWRNLQIEYLLLKMSGGLWRLPDEVTIEVTLV